MISINKKNRHLLYKYTPIILLFISIMNEIDFNLDFEYFSFNFAYILIFYYSLKREGSIGYILIFIAGLFNDVVNGLPMGISSLSYLLLCTAASYLRNITVRPHLIKDWFYFLFVISLINSINYSILFLFFSYDLDIMFYVINNLFTFLLYIPISFILNYYFKAIND